jgi:hypothetical protein
MYKKGQQGRLEREKSQLKRRAPSQITTPALRWVGALFQRSALTSYPSAIRSGSLAISAGAVSSAVSGS